MNWFKKKAKEPKFHYDDKVVILRGFYKGQQGSVIALGNKPDTYAVKLLLGDLAVFIAVHESDIDDVPISFNIIPLKNHKGEYDED